MLKFIDRKVLTLRASLLKYLLTLMEFKNIRGHCVYYPILNQESVVLDLGANKGEFTNYIRNQYKSKCYAIEANEKLFHEIESEFVQKMNVAITKEDGPINFFLSKNNESSSLIRDFESQWGKLSEVVVEGICWKSMLRKLELENLVIDVLKIDIEGAELELIENFDEGDAKLINQITVEFHDWLNRDLHVRTIKAIKKLVSYDFICLTGSPNHSWPVEALFVRKEVLDFNFFQRMIFKLFNLFTFLKY